MRTIIGLACLLLMLSSAVQAAEPPMVALVSALSGTASINRTAAALLSPLASGDVVALKPEASAVLSFVRDGTRIRLHGPCRAKVNPKGVTVLSGRRALAERPTLHQGQKVAFDMNVNKMGGLVERSASTPPLLFLGDPASMVTTPHFCWRLQKGFAPKHITIRINSADGYDQTWIVPARADGFTVPEEKELSAGGRYEVYLFFEDKSGDHHQAPPEHLRVLKTDQIKRLKELQVAARAANADTTPVVQLIGAYTQQQLYGPALREVTALSRRRPEDRNLTFLMGWLHKQRHELPQAKALFGKAISLGFPRASVP